MTRDDILKDILNLNGKNYLLELATGTGKSRIALEKIKSLHDNKAGSNLLIVVPRNTLKNNWANEVDKWWKDCNLIISYTTYVSFPKCKGKWDFVIFDECHHLSERCREALCDFNIECSILLSATVNKSLKDELIEVFDNLILYKKDLRDVIDSKILPDPKVYLIPLTLRNDIPSETIWINPKAKGKLISCDWVERWKYIKQKTYPVCIHCTESQYYYHISSQIEWWKKKYMRSRSTISKNKWLQLCGARLKWLSNNKNRYISSLLKHLSDYRTLTFCNNIEQTELLGKYCINSKNDKSVQYLNDFNDGKIKHITTCNILNEGVNLVNCQIGIYANLNSSEAIIKQRIGRLLRHPKPIIIIPYYKGTREEELVQSMLENYNTKLVYIIDNIRSINI